MKLAPLMFIILVFVTGCRDEPSPSVIQAKSPNRRIGNEVYPRLIEIPEMMNDQDLLLYVMRLYAFDSTIVLKKSGQHNGYNKKKSLVFTGNFKDGKPDGIFHFMDKYGRKLYSVVYQKGIKEGPIVFYTGNGFLKASGMFKNNNLTGNWLEWYDYKTPRMQKFIDKDNTVNIFEYNRKGNLIRKGTSTSETDSSVIIRTTHYYDNGEIREECKELFLFFRGSYYIDSNKTYYSNGNLKCIGSYIRKIGATEMKMITSDDLTAGRISFRKGRWICYDSIGSISSVDYFNRFYKLVRRDEYNSGKIRTVTEYNGVVQYSCSRSMGYYVKEGGFTEYYDDKAVKITGNYIANEKTGKWKYYQSNGKLIKKELYVHDTLR